MKQVLIRFGVLVCALTILGGIVAGCGSGTVEEAPATTSEPSKGKAGGGGAGKMTNYRGVDE